MGLQRVEGTTGRGKLPARSFDPRPVWLVLDYHEKGLFLLMGMDERIVVRRNGLKEGNARQIDNGKVCMEIGSIGLRISRNRCGYCTFSASIWIMYVYRHKEHYLH